MPACLSCGAQLGPSDTRCPLCGTLAGAADPDVIEADAVESRTVEPVGAPVAEARSCAACGHLNPGEARFCNACGAPLAARPAPLASAPLPSTGTRPSSDPGRRALLLVAAGVAMVALLYAVTAWSGRQAPAAETAAAPAAGSPAVGAATLPDGPTPPLPDTAQVAADRQAALGTPGGFYESGRYYLTAAFEATGTNPQASAQWARRAREEFERSLALRDDPDVRLALAEALRFDPSSSPMQPIEEVQRVLAVAPDHPGANYLMGDLRLMRAQFQPQWADSARASFQRVIETAPPGSELRLRAEQAVRDLGAPAAAN